MTNIVHHKISKKPVEHNPNKWMLSFADLLSLVLTFFVLIFAMAKPIQFTNEYKENYNSSIQFEQGDEESQIKLAQEVAVEDEYLLSIILNKIENDEGMEEFSAMLENDKLTLQIANKDLTEAAATALYNTIKSTASETWLIASSLGSAKKAAYLLKNTGMKRKISYYSDKSLQNIVKIIVYPKF